MLYTKGVTHTLWKMIMITYRQDPRVLKAVEFVKKRANGIDEISGLPSDHLEVHHIRSWSKYPEGRADVKNMVAIDRIHHHGYVHNGIKDYLDARCSEKAIEGYRRLHDLTEGVGSPYFNSIHSPMSKTEKALRKTRISLKENYKRVSKMGEEIDVVMKCLTNEPMLSRDIAALTGFTASKIGKMMKTAAEAGLVKSVIIKNASTKFKPRAAFYIQTTHEIHVDAGKKVGNLTKAECPTKIHVDAGKKVGNLTKAECPTKMRGISISDEELITRAKGKGWEATNARRTLKQRGFRVECLNNGVWFIMYPPEQLREKLDKLHTRARIHARPRGVI